MLTVHSDDAFLGGLDARVEALVRRRRVTKVLAVPQVGRRRPPFEIETLMTTAAHVPALARPREAALNVPSTRIV